MRLLSVDLMGGLIMFCITSVSGQYSYGGIPATSPYYYYGYYAVPAPSPIIPSSSTSTTNTTPSPIIPSSSTSATNTTPPSSPTPSTDSGCDGLESTAGDGYCDDSNNSLACDWDGGDCCRCTCEEADFSCLAFECLDPDAPTDCEADSSAESDASSPGSTTSTDTSFSGLAVTGIVIASVTGYCLLGGLLTLAVTSILRKRREKIKCAKMTRTEVV